MADGNDVSKFSHVFAIEEYFVCIFISDSYFMASLLMHSIILARGGVGLKMFNFESFFL